MPLGQAAIYPCGVWRDARCYPVSFWGSRREKGKYPEVGVLALNHEINRQYNPGDDVEKNSRPILQRQKDISCEARRLVFKPVGKSDKIEMIHERQVFGALNHDGGSGGKFLCEGLQILCYRRQSKRGKQYHRTNRQKQKCKNCLHSCPISTVQT